MIPINIDFTIVKVKINAHVASFTSIIGTTTAAAYLISFAFGKTEEEKIRILVNFNFISNLSCAYRLCCFKQEAKNPTADKFKRQREMQQLFDDMRDESKKEIMDKKFNGNAFLDNQSA